MGIQADEGGRGEARMAKVDEEWRLGVSTTYVIVGVRRLGVGVGRRSRREEEQRRGRGRKRRKAIVNRLG